MFIRNVQDTFRDAGFIRKHQFLGFSLGYGYQDYFHRPRVDKLEEFPCLGWGSVSESIVATKYQYLVNEKVEVDIL